MALKHKWWCSHHSINVIYERKAVDVGEESWLSGLLIYVSLFYASLTQYHLLQTKLHIGNLTWVQPEKLANNYSNVILKRTSLDYVKNPHVDFTFTSTSSAKDCNSTPIVIAAYWLKLKITGELEDIHLDGAGLVLSDFSWCVPSTFNFAIRFALFCQEGTCLPHLISKRKQSQMISQNATAHYFSNNG